MPTRLISSVAFVVISSCSEFNRDQIQLRQSDPSTLGGGADEAIEMKHSAGHQGHDADLSLQSASGLCAAQGRSTRHEFIRSVKINAVNISSGDNGGYYFHPDSVITGADVSIELTPATRARGSRSAQYYRVWIDLNRNNQFESNELMGTISGVGKQIISFRLPESALTNPHFDQPDVEDLKMRISMRSGAFAEACGSFIAGEVEDYIVKADVSTVEEPAITITQSSAAGGGTRNIVHGWEFTPLVDITISTLSLLDFNGTGFRDEHEVAIFDIVTKEKLTQTIFKAGSSDPLVGHFRHRPVPQIVLRKGRSYAVVAHYPSVDDYMVSRDDGWEMNYSQFLLITGDRRAMYPEKMTFPNDKYSTDSSRVHIGPSFQIIATPEQLSKFRFATNGKQMIAITTDKTVQWGVGGVKIESGSAKYRAVSRGYGGTCYIDESGKVECYSRSIFDGTLPFISSASAISSGRSASCAIDKGQVKCWDSARHQQTNTTPSINNADEIAVGGSHACAIASKEVKCWAIFGSLDVSILNPPMVKNPYKIEAGQNNTCVADDEGVKCWGLNQEVNRSMPNLFNVTDLTVGTISSGQGYACVISESKVRCWGDSPKMTMPPEMVNPTALFSGTYDSANICAISGDGIKCWGYDRENQSLVPEILQGIEFRKWLIQ